jgi:hypothetical protein
VHGHGVAEAVDGAGDLHQAPRAEVVGGAGRDDVGPAPGLALRTRVAVESLSMAVTGVRTLGHE